MVHRCNFRLGANLLSSVTVYKQILLAIFLSIFYHRIRDHDAPVGSILLQNENSRESVRYYFFSRCRTLVQSESVSNVASKKTVVHYASRQGSKMQKLKKKPP